MHQVQDPRQSFAHSHSGDSQSWLERGAAAGQQTLHPRLSRLCARLDDQRQGNDRAEYNLGAAYTNGQGIAKDDGQAFAWFRKAAEHGNEAAKKKLEGREAEERQKQYKRITFDDFVLDGKELAANETKISIQGVYIRRSEVELLLRSPMAAAMAQHTGDDVGVGLMTDDAPRRIRKFFLDCRNNPAATALGCQITVLGHAAICVRVNLVGTKSVPCLAVDDGIVAAH
jgi:hypothetical protein